MSSYPHCFSGCSNCTFCLGSKSLGAWQPDHGLELHRNADSMWEADAQLGKMGGLGTGDMWGSNYFLVIF